MGQVSSSLFCWMGPANLHRTHTDAHPAKQRTFALHILHFTRLFRVGGSTCVPPFQAASPSPSPSARRRDADVRPQASQWRFLTCARNHRRCVRFASAFFLMLRRRRIDRRHTRAGCTSCCAVCRRDTVLLHGSKRRPVRAVQITLPSTPHADIDLDLPTYLLYHYHTCVLDAQVLET